MTVTACTEEALKHKRMGTAILQSSEEENNEDSSSTSNNHNDDDDDTAPPFDMPDLSGVNFDDVDDEPSSSSGLANDSRNERIVPAIGKRCTKQGTDDSLALAFEARTEDSLDGAVCDDDEKPVISSSIPCGGDVVDTDNNNNNYDDDTDNLRRIAELSDLLHRGRYVDVLRGETASILFGDDDDVSRENDTRDNQSVVSTIREKLLSYCCSVAACVEAELVGVAALNLFLQLNYTGPSIEIDSPQGQNLAEVNPHGRFRHRLASSSSKNSSTREYRNRVLAELAVDGELPYRLCEGPYFLLLARAILSTLANPYRRDWSRSAAMEDPSSSLLAAVERHGDFFAIVDDYRNSHLTEDTTGSNLTMDYSVHDHLLPDEFVNATCKLVYVPLWSARAAIAHQRLLQTDLPSVTLWNEVQQMFEKCIRSFCMDIRPTQTDDDHVSRQKRIKASRIMLEWGLAQHYFERTKKGKAAFEKARQLSGLTIEVTGAEGKRTKFQTKATAQMLVRASSAATNPSQTTNGKCDIQTSNVPSADNNNNTTNQNQNPNQSKTSKLSSKMIQHNADEILLERIQFSNQQYNTHQPLTSLDQTILLAFCLDVKNENPMDGLTAEQMTAYLERVLRHHDDWMIHSTALLERARLEFERSHARERALLQIQALVDQHANRLTITQSTFKSLEESAPVRDRLRNLHVIVYPPRWSLKRDLAERYAKLGIVTSAAEMFREVEMWDEVVECYRRAGKEGQAETIVRRQIDNEAETPRMWTALGDITEDPSCYEKAITLSDGKYSAAFVALGQYHFQKGALAEASRCLQRAVEIKPLSPVVWFRLGTIGMQCKDWDMALKAFSEVVQQEPEEGDAWANVAAIHMHNRCPEKAYPALLESLKQNRNNWRVWINKLYTCIDLQKYDEAIQACHQLIELKTKQSSSNNIPPLEQKCIRAIVGGSIQLFQDAIASKDAAAIDSAQRTTRRLEELLATLSASATSEPWIWETCAVFKDGVGISSESILEDLRKEYRALMATNNDWATNDAQLSKVCDVAMQISELQKQTGDGENKRQNLTKVKMMLNGLIKKIRAAYVEDHQVPNQVVMLENALKEIEELIRGIQ